MTGEATRARLASAPLASSPMVVLERKVCPPCWLTVGSRNNVLAYLERSAREDVTA
jgi:hypothetical protein